MYYLHFSSCFNKRHHHLFRYRVGLSFSLQSHSHHFDMWRNTQLDMPAMPSNGCYAVIGQSLFRAGFSQGSVIDGWWWNSKLSACQLRGNIPQTVGYYSSVMKKLVTSSEHAGCSIPPSTHISIFHLYQHIRVEQAIPVFYQSFPISSTIDSLSLLS